MNTSDHDDLDRTMRKAAHESIAAHRRSIEPGDVESALRSSRAPERLVAGRTPGHRRTVAALAAAGVVALVGALVVVSGDTADEQNVPASNPIVDPVPTLPSTTTIETVSSTSVAPPDVPGEVLVFDVDGNPMDGLDAGGPVAGDGSAFADVLHDHLVNRSDILGGSVAEREQSLFDGGLRIHTTLDPDAQAAADAARTELPSNAAGIDAALVSLDTTTGAVRAMVGAPAAETGATAPNMVITPRQTGSAVGSFILAAAIEAGAQAGDQIDARRGCRFPSDDQGGSDLLINAGVAGFVGDLRDVTARGVPCGSARLSHIVGLDDVVDTMYRTAGSAYLDPDDPDRERLQPYAGLALGVNEMTALDMAAGMQTIANEGVHHDPYFVEYVDDADGNRLYTHRPDGRRELGRDTSLETIDILEGILTYGTARNLGPLDDDRPAFGITGTMEDNTNAWFVGATPQLTTAVWVGDPTAYTPMIAIPEFEFPRIQGGTYPAQIWNTFTDEALAGLPLVDWADPPAPTRPNARLVLPGVECRLDDPTSEPSPTNLPAQIEPEEPITTVELGARIVDCG